MKRQIQEVKRVLAGFLVAVMVLTIIPQSAFAAEVETNTEYEENVISEETVIDEMVSEIEEASETIDAEEAEVETEETSQEVISEEAVTDDVPDDNTDTVYSVDLSGVDEDIVLVSSNGITKKDDKLTVKAGDDVVLNFGIKEEKYQEKAVLIDSVKGTSNNNELCEEHLFVTDEGFSVQIDDVFTDIVISAETTDKHKITFVTDGSVEAKEPIIFSENNKEDPTFSFVKIDDGNDYDLTVSYSRGNAAKNTLTANDGVYTLPVHSKGMDTDYTVYVVGKQKKYGISVNGISISQNSIDYRHGYASYAVLSLDEVHKYTAGNKIMLRINGVASNKSVLAINVKFGDKDEIKKYYATNNIVTIPAEDAFGDILIDSIEIIARTYKVTFDNELAEYYTSLEAPAVATAGEDYVFKIKNVSWVNFINLLFYNQSSEVEFIEYSTELNAYVIPSCLIEDNIYIGIDKIDYAKYDISLTKDVDGIYVTCKYDSYIEYDLTVETPIKGGVVYGTDLLFTIVDSKSDNRDMPTVTAKCNGVAVPVNHSYGMDYYINGKYIKGNIELTVTPATIKRYDVNWNNGEYKLDGARVAVKGKDYSFKVTPLEGYEIKTVVASVGGENIAFKRGSSVNSLPGNYVIKAADITGRIDIDVTTVNKKINVSYVTNGATVKIYDSNSNPCTPVEGKEQWIVEANKNLDINASIESPAKIVEVGVIKDSTYFKLYNGAGDCTIAAKYLTSDITLVVKTAMKYAIDYNDGNIDVTASSGNRALDTDSNTFWLTSDDKEVTFTLTPKKHYWGIYGNLPAFKCAGTKVTIAGKDAGVVDKNNQITIKKDKINGIISFYPESIENVICTTENDDSVVVNKSANFTITAKDYKRYSLYKTSGMEFVEATDDSHYDKKSSTLVFTDADAGKTIKIPVTLNGKKIYYTFNVAKEPTSLSIKGFKANKTTQAAGSSVEYQIVSTPANADLSRVTVSVNGLQDEIVSVPVENGKFTIDAPVADAKDITVEVKLADECKYTGTITTSVAAVTNATPTISLVRATDDYIKVKLSVPKTIDVNTKNINYEVYAIDPETKEICCNTFGDFEDDVLTLYVGPGKAKNYDVKAVIIQYNDELKTIATSKEATKRLSTLNPCVETKLGVTTKTTKLTQGDKNVLIATAKYSNKTTYVDCLGKEPEIVSAPTGGNSAISFTSGDDNSVIVDVNSNAPAGKYVIRLTAQVPEGSDAIPSTVDFTVTVGERIKWNTTVTASIESQYVYKAAGKEATNAIKIVANKGINTKNIGMMLDNPSASQGISIKNGKVIIPKNYAVFDQDNGDIVRVQIYDTSSERRNDSNSGCWLYFKIMSKPVCIFDISIDEVCPNGKTVNYSDINGRDIVVRDEYGNQVDTSKYTLKLSSNLYFNNFGELEATKAGKASITATATDGSKASKTINFTIGYSDAGYEVWSQTLTQITDHEFINNLYSVQPYYFIILNRNDDAINTKISVKGAKIGYTNTAINACGLVLMPNAEETIVTVNDLTTKRKDEYKIRNTHFNDEKKAKAMSYRNLSGKIYAGYKADGSQKIVLDIKNLPELKAGEIYTARVYIDFADSIDPKKTEEIKDSYIGLAMATGLLDSQESAIDLINNQLILNVKESSFYKLVAGTFKLTVEIVKRDANTGEALGVVNKCTTVPVTIVDAPKTTYSLTASYKFGKNGKVSKYDYVALTGKGTNATLDFTSAKLYNANLNGTTNNFKKYFEIDEQGNLVVKNASVFTDASLKNDLTGYVEYKVVNTITGKSETVVTKITCKK